MERPRNRPWRALATTLLVVALLAGCRSKPEVASPPVGSVDVALVPPPMGAARLALESSQAFVFPNLLEPVAIPAYPGDLLSLRLEPMTLCVEVVISERGDVSGVTRRIDDTCPDDAGTHETQFAQAMQAAVLQWRYDPALICRTPDGRPSGDACAEPDALESPTALRLSYAFEFSQHDGKPTVEMTSQ